eukprot:12088475-Alexandrium_andersonii.AAC.1
MSSCGELRASQRDVRAQELCPSAGLRGHRRLRDSVLGAGDAVQDASTGGTRFGRFGLRRV